MRLLLDTNILIGLVDERLQGIERSIEEAITDPGAMVHASVASLWEIAIKTRLGKLTLSVSPSFLPQLLQQIGLHLLVIDHRHVLATVEPEPRTRDPFDRILLAQCLIEDLRLVTVDRALATHPLTWRTASVR